MLTHLCRSLVIPPHPFDCCFVTPRPRPRPRPSPPRMRGLEEDAPSNAKEVLCCIVRRCLKMSFLGRATGGDVVVGYCCQVF